MNVTVNTVLIFLCLIISGCEKTTETKFKGRVVGDLNGEGINGAVINLRQDYQDNYRENTWYGPKYADADGYYEFVLEIVHHDIERFIPIIQDPSKKYTKQFYGGINMDGKFQTITLQH